jgi:DHA2 family multidrug resistance protein-like MFS transporter
VLGQSPLVAGLWSLPSAFAFIAGSIVSPSIVRRFAPVKVMTTGLLMGAAGFVILAFIGGPHALALLVLGSVVMSFGMTPVVTLTTDVVVGAAPPERAGAAASLSETSTEFGGALGIAIFGSIGTWIYRTRVGEALPADIDPGVATQVRDTLGGAVAATRELPDPLGSALLESARTAFTTGFQVSAALSVAVLIGTAVLVVTMLGRVKPGGH